jgi:hypothetical protein
MTTSFPVPFDDSIEKYCSRISGGDSRSSVSCRPDKRLGTYFFSFKQLLIYPHDTEWTSFQTYYYTEDLVALVIELWTSGCSQEL